MNDKIIEIKEKIRLLQEELEPVDIQRREILNKIIALDKELRKERLLSGDYHPMSDLENHKGEFISSIELVFKDDKGELKTEDIYGDEFFRVDMYGHLDYSSQVGGILVYDDSENSYSWWKNYKKISYNFIGYLDVEFKGEKDE